MWFINFDQENITYATVFHNDFLFNIIVFKVCVTVYVCVCDNVEHKVVCAVSECCITIVHGTFSISNEMPPHNLFNSIFTIRICMEGLNSSPFKYKFYTHTHTDKSKKYLTKKDQKKKKNVPVIRSDISGSKFYIVMCL